MNPPTSNPSTTHPRRQLLIISPHFAPTNAPDMHRARLMLPYLRDLGWEPTVLAIHPDFVEGVPIDPLLKDSYAEDIPVIRTKGISSKITRLLGFGGLWKRCGRQFTQAGDRLLSSQKFDLVFISSSQFDAFNLGPRWLKHFGVPYVLDFQDPWVNDYYDVHNIRPPGGKLKYWWSQLSAHRNEPIAVKQAAGIVCVSESYGPTLLHRYPGLKSNKFLSLPFGASEIDMQIARNHRPHHLLVSFGDGNIHHVYAGRCTANMRPALDLLFSAFKLYLQTNPAQAKRHRFHFIGTDYAPVGLARFNVMPAAQAADVSDYVTEHTARVSYYDALFYITHADALIVLGSDDLSYNASKMSPYLLAQRPVIVIAHEESQMLGLAHEYEGIEGHGYNNHPTVPDKGSIRIIHDRWFAGNHCQKPTTTIETNPHFLTASLMTKKLTRIFDQCTKQV